MVIRILSVLFCRMDLWKLKSLSHIPCFKAAYYRQLNKLGSYIGDSAYFSDIPSFPHGIKSIFISGGAKIGRNCVIYQQVTIGNNMIQDSKSYGAPTIGDGVFIGAGAIILGGVEIGNNCRIGAGAVVTKSIPDNCVVVSQPSRVIQKDYLDNTGIS